MYFCFECGDILGRRQVLHFLEDISHISHLFIHLPEEEEEEEGRRRRRRKKKKKKKNAIERVTNLEEQERTLATHR
jgi:hypothetical protein